MNKKKILILVCTIVMLLVLLICFWRPITRIFKKTESLNYENVTYYTVISDDYSFEIRDNAGIEKVTNYLNSLELVKEESCENYHDDFLRDESFLILIMDEGADAISFYREYISLNIDSADDSVNTEYYVVDSGYNSKDGSSKMLKFLEELINKYAEE